MDCPEVLAAASAPIKVSPAAVESTVLTEKAGCFIRLPLLSLYTHPYRTGQGSRNRLIGLLTSGAIACLHRRSCLSRLWKVPNLLYQVHI